MGKLRMKISVLICFFLVFSGVIHSPADLVFAEEELPAASKASDAFGNMQGAGGWSWQRVPANSYENNAYEDMDEFANGYWWYSQENDWTSGRIGNTEAFLGTGDYDLAMTYTASIDGVVDITAIWDSIAVYSGYTSEDGVYAAVYKNGFKVWPTGGSGAKQLVETNAAASFETVTLSVKAGDQLHFRLNKNESNTGDNIVWNPVVTYTSDVYNPVLDPEIDSVYSFSDDFSSTQGEKGWHYLSSPIGGKLVIKQGGFFPGFLDGVWASGKDNWTDGVIGPTFIQPGRLADAIIAFKAPFTGNVSISVNGDVISLVDSTSAPDAGDGASVAIVKSSAGETSQVWPNTGFVNIANGGNVAFSPIEIDVKRNEYIYFRANKGISNNYRDVLQFLPIITYSSMDVEDPGVADLPAESEKYEPNEGVNDTLLPAPKDFSQLENKGNFDFTDFVTNEANNVDGTVTIPPGVYTITHQPNEGNAVFHVSDLHDVVIQATDVKFVFLNAAQTALIFDNCEDVTLKGLTIEYSGSTSGNMAISEIRASSGINFEDVALYTASGTALEVTDSDNVHLNKLQLLPRLSESSSSGIGIYLKRTSSNVTVTNSLFVGNRFNAIVDHSDDGTQIENNKFMVQTSNAILLKSSGAIVKNNSITESNGSGIIAGKGAAVRNILIAKNRISDTGMGINQSSKGAIIVNNNTNSVIMGNVFTGLMSSQAIDVQHGKNVTVADNRFTEYEGTPLHLHNVDNALVNNNVNIGSVLKSGDTKRVYGNDIQDDSNVSVGADMSRLPQIDNRRFVGMEKRAGVSVAGELVPLQQYIAEAYNNGLSSVIIPPGAYSLQESEWSHLTFNRMKDFAVYAYGVFIECEKYTSSAIQIWNSKNITIKGLTMDYKLVANTQGTIVSKNGANFVWKADEGYPSDLTDLSLFDVNSWAEVFQHDQERAYYDVGFGQKTKNPDGTVTLQDAVNLSGNAYPLVQHAELNVGDKLVFRGKTSHVNYTVDSSGIKYEDVIVYGGSGFGFMELNGDGGTQLNRVAFTPGPPPIEGAPERLISTCDATHSTNMRSGIQVRNSLFEKMTDDAANVHSTYGEVSSFDSQTKQITYSGKYVDPIFRTGDRVLVYTLDGKLLSEATAVSDTVQTQNANIITIDKDFDYVEGQTIIQNASASGEGFLYENCVVRNNRSRGFLIKASNGTIRNSTLEDNGMSAILVKPEISDGWGESGFSRDLVIENNLIKNSGYYTGSELHSPINISSDREPTSDRAYMNHKNIVIRNNVFQDRYTKYALNINGVDGLVIEGNDFGSRIDAYDGFDPSIINFAYPNDTAPAIKLSGAYEVSISDNMYPAFVTIKAEIDQTAVNVTGSDLD